MGIHIEDAETERLARELAARTGESIPESTRRALAERLERVQEGSEGKVDRSAVEDILRRISSYPELDARSSDEILGYDGLGLPS